MLDKIFANKFFYYPYRIVLFLLACIIVIQNKEINGVILFGYIASFALVTSSRLTDAMLPAMLLCVFATRCYNSADIFIAKIPLIVPMVVAIIAHFIIYRRKFVVGKSFRGLCAIAIATAIGGCGTITSEEYFAGGALYYSLGLGIGMVVFYLVVKSHLKAEEYDNIATIMYMVGLLASFSILWFYVSDWDNIIKDMRPISIQSDNNLATFLMLAMPFPLYYASKCKIHLLSFGLMYFCTIISGSRGGLLMGTIEFLGLLVLYAVVKETPISNKIMCVSTIIAFFVIGAGAMPQIVDFYGFSTSSDTGNMTVTSFIEILKGFFINKNEARAKLLERMLEDFKTNPIFGVGLGYTGNEDIYNPVKGAMNWYHMWLPQIIAGLGLIGVAAYLWQLMDRILIFIRHYNYRNLVFFMGYIGLFLMSQVNPGEFCPMPYAALGVTFFIVMETDGAGGSCPK